MPSSPSPSPLLFLLPISPPEALFSEAPLHSHASSPFVLLLLGSSCWGFPPMGSLSLNFYILLMLSSPSPSSFFFALLAPCFPCGYVVLKLSSFRTHSQVLSFFCVEALLR
eukprot:TRINITY_DN3078_c0_g1_i1.p1 TRINITY_DN3078_c0_g1~~TRINITY_DN3078_c0_g1_i1.p1  ORF type:complete len:111 (-),score=11.63 TRINITY_DN3078_c0_g1_i1:249-581(-)